MQLCDQDKAAYLTTQTSKSLEILDITAIGTIPSTAFLISALLAMFPIFSENRIGSQSHYFSVVNVTLELTNKKFHYTVSCNYLGSFLYIKQQRNQPQN